ncbi:MCE family protein [Streptomyces atacamensis]|uniref:MCE family protein n=1 Tax=Streptomyces atacamensis TaxID=531966 RepID=UPI00399CE3EA
MSAHPYGSAPRRPALGRPAPRRPVLRRPLPGAALLGALSGSLLLSGCGFGGLHDVPLPGGAATGDDAYRVTVEFRDVMDLVPQSSVKVNDVTVGAVEKVELDGWKARVRLRISDSVKLPGNAVAELRQTSILGEKYVSLSAPPAGVEPAGRLGDGDRVPLSRSDRHPEIEEVLSALSALLNGGGVAQLKTITKELNSTLDGREDRIKALLEELDTFIGGLDDQRDEIVRAIEGIDRLSKRLRKEEKTIGKALDDIPPALEVLADQRGDLTKMLRALSRLGTAGTRVINASQDDLVANLRHLRPILKQLNAAGDDLPNALELMTTYPFPRNVVDSIRGDYVNLEVTADLDLKSLYGNLDDGPDDPRTPRPPEPPAIPEPPGVPELPGVPGLPEIPGTPDVPDVPDVPGLPEPPGGEPDGDPDGGGGPLCPPVCTGSPAAYHAPAPVHADAYRADGVDRALADLMTKGIWG